MSEISLFGLGRGIGEINTELLEIQVIFDSAQWSDVLEEVQGYYWRGWAFRLNVDLELEGISSIINVSEGQGFGAAIWELDEAHPEYTPEYDRVVAEVYQEEEHDGEIELDLEETVELNAFRTYLIMCGRSEGSGSVHYPLDVFDHNKPFELHKYLDHLYPRGPYTEDNYQRFWSSYGTAEDVSGSSLSYVGGYDARPVIGIYGKVISEDIQRFLEITDVTQHSDHNVVSVSFGGDY